jgi:hypothetical protein
VEYRIIQLVVCVLWLTSMVWLVSTKVLPRSVPQESPNHRLVGPGTDALPERVRWQIEYRRQIIGTAMTTIIRPSDGSPVVDTVVNLDQVPLGEMLEQVVGIWPLIAQAAGVYDQNLQVSLHVGTRMHFDRFGNLLFFHSDVGLDQTMDVLRVRGRMIAEDRLQLIVSAGTGLPASAWGGKTDLLKHELQVSPDALIVDGLSPHPRLANLRVGQEWSMQSVRAFAPGSPLRTIRARVEREQLVAWDRDMERMHVVLMEDVSPQGLTTTHDAKVRLWVRSDGSVVRQQMELAGLVIDFQRLPDESTRGFAP